MARQQLDPSLPDMYLATPLPVGNIYHALCPEQWDLSPLESLESLESVQESVIPNELSTWDPSQHATDMYDQTSSSYLLHPTMRTSPLLLPRAEKQSSKSPLEAEVGSPTQSPSDVHDTARKERRRAQNRAAQRAYRRRKDSDIEKASKQVEETSEQLYSAHSTNQRLREEIEDLRAQVVKLQTERLVIGFNRPDERAARCFLPAVNGFPTP